MTLSENNAVIVTVTYPNQPRKCKHFIIALLKQKLAKTIHRTNYVKSYSLEEGAVKKQEEKLLTIYSSSAKKERLITMIHKLHPDDAPEITIVCPDHVDQQYMNWLQE